jgi:beta-phosphoglucomutase-like phosphatase (HAD superfamily)
MKAKGIKLALVTGSPRSVIDEFKTQDEIFELFDCIITDEDTKKGKPNPDPYFAATECLGIPSKNCYVIENAPLGIKSAASAGLTCFAIKGNGPLSEEDLRKAGAIRIYKDIEDLRRHIIWADANINLDDFIELFENELSNC